MFVFDCIFMLDKILDLFVTFYTPRGKIEHRLFAVILNNLSSKFFIEFIISLVPAYLFIGDIKSFWYALWKVPRYDRLFEMDTHI